MLKKGTVHSVPARKRWRRVTGWPWTERTVPFFRIIDYGIRPVDRPRKRTGVGARNPRIPSHGRGGHLLDGPVSSSRFPPSAQASANPSKLLRRILWFARRSQLQAAFPGQMEISSYARASFVRLELSPASRGKFPLTPAESLLTVYTRKNGRVGEAFLDPTYRKLAKTRQNAR